MIRIINQEEARREAWDLWIAGAGKKNETFQKYARRIGAEARTPESSTDAAETAARTIQAVKNKLGRFYRPPAQA